jgi:MraZ protein
VQGVYLQVDATLDPKGRLVLPARLRRKLIQLDVDALVIKVHPDLKAVFGYTEQDWATKIEGTLDDGHPFSMPQLDLEHAYLAGAQTVEVDNQGRILIPPKMREEAELDRDLVVNVLRGRLEIWSAARWADRASYATGHTRTAEGIHLLERPK